VANRDAVPHLPDYHAESDTFDRLNQREEQSNADCDGAHRAGCEQVK
jgi:hypothetical protein